VGICCLEQDFPINFHTPVVAREILTCGGCLIGSTEMIKKARAGHRLIDKYNCIAIDDVRNVGDLEKQLVSVVERPELAAEIRLHAREYGLAVEAGNRFPQRLDAIFSGLTQTRRLFPEYIAKPTCESAGKQSHG
jgi:hypothetical protein